MRALSIVLFPLFLTALAQAEVSKPVCQAIGTRSEGWYLDGQLIQKTDGRPAYDNCTDKIALCVNVGTRSEGWYTAIAGPFLKWDNCADAIEKPMCGQVGTRSEGWYYRGKLLKRISGELAYDQCADKIAYCVGIGTRSEGWAVAVKPQLLIWAHCAP